MGERPGSVAAGGPAEHDGAEGVSNPVGFLVPRAMDSIELEEA